MRFNRCKYCLLPLLLLCFYHSSSQGLKEFNNGDIRLYYEEFGSGPALYILAGGPGEPPTRPYLHIIDSLKSFYTCILLHQRGAGASRNIPINDSTISIKKYTEDIALLQRKRGDRKITLLGMSWGGLLAMNYTALHPEKVSDLILVCSAPPSYKIWNVLYDNQFVRRSSAELDSMALLEKIFSQKNERELYSLKIASPSAPEVVAYKKFIEIHVRAMYYDRAKILPSYIDELFYQFNFQVIPIIDQEVLTTKWDITAELKKINTKALIIYGRQDDQGESTFYLQKECLRNSEMHVIEQCGHEILMEKPEAFFKILMHYVKRRVK
jgi:proline iminopeptidase